jgi:hypothetical protein
LTWQSAHTLFSGRFISSSPAVSFPPKRVRGRGVSGGLFGGWGVGFEYPEDCGVFVCYGLRLSKSIRHGDEMDSSERCVSDHTNPSIRNPPRRVLLLLVSSPVFASSLTGRTKGNSNLDYWVRAGGYATPQAKICLSERGRRPARTATASADNHEHGSKRRTKIRTTALRQWAPPTPSAKRDNPR